MVRFHLWYLFIKNLKLMLRDRLQIIWTFGYPLLFIILFAVAFNDDDDGDVSVVIFNDDDDGIVDPENSPYSKASLILEDALEDDFDDTIEINDDYNKYKDAKKDLKYEKIDAIITIDVFFSEAIFNITPNIQAEIEILTTSDAYVEEIIESVINQIVDKIRLEYNNIGETDIDCDDANSVKMDTVDYLAPSFIVAGVLISISQLTALFAEDKEKKTLERLGTTPVSRRNIILSGVLSQLVICSIQVISMILIATMVFGIHIHPNANLMLLFLIPMLFCFTCLGLGLILASFVKSSNTAFGLAFLITLPLQFLGGVFSESISDVPLSEYNPTSYANHAMRLVMTNGISNWEAIGMDILILLGFGIVFLLVGIILFQRKTSISK